MKLPSHELVPDPASLPNRNYSNSLSRREMGLLLALNGLNIVLRLPYLYWKVLQGDEALYVTSAVRMLGIGGLPYEVGADNRGPLLHWIMALLFEVFGVYNMRAVRLFMMLWTSLSVVALFFMMRRFFTAGIAGYGCVIMILAATSDRWLLAANVEIFALPLILGSLYAGMVGLVSGRLHAFLISGVLAGLGFITKQPFGILVLAAGVALLLQVLRQKDSWRASVEKLAIYLSGFLVSVLIVMAIYHFSGKWETFKFYFWDFNTLVMKAGGLPGIDLRTIVEDAVRFRSSISLLYVVTFGLLLVNVVRLARGARDFRGEYLAHVLLVTYFILSYLVIHLRGPITPNYFGTLLPAFGVLAGYALGRPLERLRAAEFNGETIRRSCAALLAAALLVLTFGREISGASHLFGQEGIFFREWKARWIGSNGRPAGEYGAVADYVRQRMSPGEPLFLWSPDPAIYIEVEAFPSSRFTTANYFAALFYSLYPLEVSERLKAQLLEDLKRYPPRYIIYDGEVMQAVPQLRNPIFGLLVEGWEVEANIGAYVIYRRRL